MHVYLYTYVYIDKYIYVYRNIYAYIYKHLENAYLRLRCGDLVQRWITFRPCNLQIQVFIYLCVFARACASLCVHVYVRECVGIDGYKYVHLFEVYM